MLDKKTIDQLFEALNKELAKQNIEGELFLVGGAAMCLAFDARPSTKDILGISSYEKAIALITAYYPLDQFPQKTRYILEELLEG